MNMMRVRNLYMVAIGLFIGGLAAGDGFAFSAPVTHSDWMLRDGVAWGPEGVHHMLDMCKQSGWSVVHWRVLDGGRSLYKSKLMDPQGKWDTDNFWNPVAEEDRKLVESYTGGMKPEARAELLHKIERYDYGTFDSFAEAVRYGHEIGLKIYAWISVNEDDHGWGLRSRFAKAHPDLVWKKRDGTPYRSQLSFAFPQVMEYKLAVVREILDHYDVDGLFIDWLRTGDVRDNPQTDAGGVADHGYEEPMIQGFQAKYGEDPRKRPNGEDRWVRYRAEPHTAFMREVRKHATSKKAGMPVAALVVHPWCYRGQMDKIDGNLRGMLLDVAAWAKEGLVDAVLPAGYYRDGATPEKAYQALREETDGRAEVWYYTWVPTTLDDIKRDTSAAAQSGAKHILLWEGDYIDGRPNKTELQAAMRECTKRHEP